MGLAGTQGGATQMVKDDIPIPHWEWGSLCLAVSLAEPSMVGHLSRCHREGALPEPFC